MDIPSNSKRILGVNDLRGTPLVSGLPADLFGKGLVVGFSDAGSLDLPEIPASEFGNLTVSAMAAGVDQIDCIFREFTHPTARYIQHALSPDEWGPWETHAWDHSGFARLHREQEFTEPQIFGKAVVESVVDLGLGTEVDVILGGVFTKIITEPTTLSVIGADEFLATGVAVVSFALRLTDGGLEEVTWWPGIQWPGGNKPSLTPSGVDLLGFVSIDSGATWLGVILGQNYK